MRKSLDDIKHMIIQSKRYPDLPSELKPYYAYITDCGHSIMAIPKVLFARHKGSAEDLWQFEVPVPVKYIQSHVYYIYEGYIIVDLPYDEAFGVEIDEKYEEY